MSRKNNPDRSDVPNSIVVGVVILLLVIFVPIVRPMPALPTHLPPVRYDAMAIERSALAGAGRPTPAFVDEAYTLLLRAIGERQLEGVGPLQREFAAFMYDFAGEDIRARQAVRQRYLREFLRARRERRPHPLLGVARRHRLLAPESPPWLSDAMVIAWFDMRWEMLAARDSATGDAPALDRLLQRLPPEERRALAAWIVASECDAILGAPAGASFTPRHLEGCASVRREFVGLAYEMDHSYPLDEARGTIEVLLARGFEQLARALTDDDQRAGARAGARDAYDRASGYFTRLLAQAPSRRIRRFQAGVLAAATD